MLKATYLQISRRQWALVVSTALKVYNWRTCSSHMFHLDTSTCRRDSLWSVFIIPKSSCVWCCFFRRSCHGPCWIRRMTTRQPLMCQKTKPLASQSHPRRPDGNPVGLDMVRVRELSTLVKKAQVCGRKMLLDLVEWYEMRDFSAILFLISLWFESWS